MRAMANFLAAVPRAAGALAPRGEFDRAINVAHPQVFSARGEFPTERGREGCCEH